MPYVWHLHKYPLIRGIISLLLRSPLTRTRTLQSSSISLEQKGSEIICFLNCVCSLNGWMMWQYVNVPFWLFIYYFSVYTA